MVKLFIVGASVLFTVSICYSAKIQEKVKLSVYYETLCPDSVRFFRNELKRTVAKISSHFTTEFIPYGIATHYKENGAWKFSCQHGEPECIGNKLHACALAQNNGEEKDVDLLVCSMTSRNPSSAVILQNCTETVGVAFEPIDKCFKSGEADELLAKYGDRTAAVTPNVFYIPTIILNDVYNQTFQDGAEFDLLQTICGRLENKPNECKVI